MNVYHSVVHGSLWSMTINKSSVENTFTFHRNVSSPPPVVIMAYKFDVLLLTDVDIPDLLF